MRWNRHNNRKHLAVSASAFIVMTLFLAGCSTNTLVLRQQGKAAMDRGDYQAAAHKFTQVLNANPADAKALYLRGVTLLKLGHPLSAQLSFGQALALQPNLSPKIPMILDDMAEAIYQQHKPRELRAFLAHQVNEHHAVSDYLRQGKYLAKIGDMDQARLAFRKGAYFAKPGDAGPYLAIAAFYESINDIPNAKKSLRYAYWVNPNDPRVSAQLRQYNVIPGPTAAVEPPKPPLIEQR